MKGPEIMAGKKQPPKELVIEVTEEHVEAANKILAKSAVSHCFRCLTPEPEDPETAWEAGWGTLLVDFDPNDEHFVSVCPDCGGHPDSPVERWLCGHHDEILGDRPEYQDHNQTKKDKNKKNKKNKKRGK